MARFQGFSGSATTYTNLRDNCRTEGVSPIGSAFVLAGSSSPIGRIMNVIRLATDGVNPLMSFNGYVAFSYFASRSAEFRQHIGVVSQDSLFAGLVSARWMLTEDNLYSAAQVVNLRDDISSYFRDKMLTHAEIINSALVRLKKVVLPTFSWAGDLTALEGNTPQVTAALNGITNIAHRIMTVVEGGGLPWDKMGVDLTTLGNANSIETLIAAIPDVMAADWDKDLTNVHIMHLCNFVGRNHPDFIRKELMRAQFISIAAICKGQNLTLSWAASRWKTIKEQYTVIEQNAPEVTKDIVAEYARLFIPRTVKLGPLYSTLMFNIRISQNLGVEALAWMVEQARGTNVTGLTAIATACTTFDICTYTVLSKLLPADNFTNAITAMLWTIRQPYITLTGPRIPIVEYADLAYVCLRLSIPEGVDGMVKSVLGKCRLERSKLHGLIDIIERCQREGTSSAFSMESLINTYHANARPAPEGNCSLLAYEKFGEAQAAAAEGAVPQRGNLTTMTRDEVNAQRALLHTYTLKELVDEKKFQPDADWKIICTSYINTVRQTRVNLDTHGILMDGHYVNLNYPPGVEEACERLHATYPEEMFITGTEVDAVKESILTPFPGTA